MLRKSNESRQKCLQLVGRFDWAIANEVGQIFVERKWIIMDTLLLLTDTMSLGRIVQGPHLNAAFPTLR